jgi:nucleotide-binding universal stress UspA family protein
MTAIRKILFPTDFSSNAAHAFRHTTRLADFNSSELIIQHVVGDYFERNPHWSTLFDVHQLQHFMDSYVDREMSSFLENLAGTARVRSVISKGKPADEIADLADREMVDLVVMGSAKGVVTNKVIRMTSRPVLAISTRLPETGQSVRPGVERILVATDLSEHSRRVVSYAFDLKRLFNASLFMLYVIETNKAIDFAIHQGHYKNALDVMREWASNQLMNLTLDEFVGDPTVVRVVERGPAGDRIAETASRIGADLTILGSHERGAFHRHLIGTTADDVLTRIKSPVLALKV